MRPDDPRESAVGRPGATRWLLGSIALLAVLGFASWNFLHSGAGEVSVQSDSSPAPEFDLAGLDGGRHRLGDYSGKVLLVDFWATWCGPCRLQADILSRLYEDVRQENVEFLAVSLGESEELVREFVRKDPFSYPVAIDPEEVLGYALEVYALPTVLIVDPHGQISFLRPGITDSETLREALAVASSRVGEVASN